MAVISRTLLFVVFVTCTLALVLRDSFDMTPMVPSTSWQVVVADKIQANDAKIPPEWKLEPQVVTDAKSRKRIAGSFIEGLLDDRTHRITALDVSDLVANMSNGSLTAVEVVAAFCKRAAYAHQLVRASFPAPSQERTVDAKPVCSCPPARRPAQGRLLHSSDCGPSARTYSLSLG